MAAVMISLKVVLHVLGLQNLVVARGWKLEHGDVALVDHVGVDLAVAVSRWESSRHAPREVYVGSRTFCAGRVFRFLP